MILSFTSVFSESSVVKIAPSARIWELGYAAASGLDMGKIAFGADTGYGRRDTE